MDRVATGRAEVWSALTTGVQWLLAAALVVSVAGFYLFPSGKLNSFPTYLVVLAVLGLAALNPRAFRAMVHARAALLGAVLLVYLVAVTATLDGLQEAMKGLRYSVLVLAFMAGVCVCLDQARAFLSVLMRAIALAAMGSALHFLLALLYLGEAVPWGRLEGAGVGASTYGLGAVIAFAIALTGLDPAKVRDGSRVAQQRAAVAFWTAVAAVLSAATWQLGGLHVLFGLLTACLVVSITTAWSQRLTPRATYWLPVIAALMVFQIMVFNSVMETGRPLIWQGAVDNVFEGDTLFGAGARADVEPSVRCDGDTPLTGFRDCRVDHVHSIYVSTLHHGGVIGLGLLVLVVLLAASDLVELPPGESRTVTLALLAYGATVLMFDGQAIIRKLDFVWLLFWLPVALAGGLYAGFRRGR